MSNELPDVEEIKQWLRLTPVDYHDSTARDHVTALLATVPKLGTTRWALWALAQGHKITINGFGTNEYLVLNEAGRIVDDTGTTSHQPATFSGTWSIYRPSPPVDDEEIKRKCVEMVAHMSGGIWGKEVVGSRFTPAQLARLREMKL